MKSKLSWVLIGIMIIGLLGGCAQQEVDKPPTGEEQVELEEPVQKEVIEEAEEIEPEQEVVTDEDFVFDNEWMWNRYMYDTITSIGNAQRFDADHLTEIDELIEYVWYRYCSEFESVEAMGFEHSTDITSYYLFPRELAFKEAEKVFAFDITKANLEDSYVYLEEFDAFQMHYVGPREDWEVSGNNPWAIYYEGVEPLKGGRYVVRMVSYEDREAGIIERENVYTLRLGEDGTFLFESGEWRMPYYPLSDFSDLIIPLDTWKDKVNEYARMIGESDQEIFFLEQDEDIQIMRVSKSDLTQIKPTKILLNPEEWLVQIRQAKDNRFFVCTSNYVRVYDELWQEIERVSLPESFTEKIYAETTWDDFTLTSIFTGYDITDDLKRIIYGDEEGLKWFELGSENPEITLLEKSEAYPDDNLAPLSVYLGPRWVNGDKKIFVVRSGYEGNRGIALYDFSIGKMNRYNHGWNIWHTQIQPDKGVIMPNEFDYNVETGQGRTLHYYLDFETGDRMEFAFDRMGAEDMPDGGETYYGENHLALLLKDYSFDPMVTYIQRVDPETWQVIDEVAVKALRLRILGMDRDGNVYIHYFYNQESRGFGVLPAID